MGKVISFNEYELKKEIKDKRAALVKEIKKLASLVPHAPLDEETKQLAAHVYEHICELAHLENLVGTWGIK